MDALKEFMVNNPNAHIYILIALSIGLGLFLYKFLRSIVKVAALILVVIIIVNLFWTTTINSLFEAGAIGKYLPHPLAEKAYSIYKDATSDKTIEKILPFIPSSKGRMALNLIKEMKEK